MEDTTTEYDQGPLEDRDAIEATVPYIPSKIDLSIFNATPAEIAANTITPAEKQAIEFYHEYPSEFLEFALQNHQEEMDTILEDFRLDTLKIYKVFGLNANGYREVDEDDE